MNFNKLLLTSFATLMFSVSANAGEFITIDMGDQLKRARAGDDTIPIRRLLRQQHGMMSRDFDLLSVVLVAKSARGHGKAELMVGQNHTASQYVEGNRQKFNQHSEQSFDRLLFENPSISSKGPWQIKLNGRFIVHQVVAEVTKGSTVLTLQYNDMMIRSRNGNNIIALKRDLQSQHGISPSQYNLDKVEVIAKSRRGGGSVQLMVGQNSSAAANIAGTPSGFQNNSMRSYDKDVLINPSARSRGRWQLHFNGNIKVKSVKVHLSKK